MSSPKPVITLDELIALNDEIAALVRAGVPLDQGLQILGADLPGKLGRYATQLSSQLARGESLTTALADSTSHVPRVYRAVVEAGMAAWRLPAALESLAGSLRRLAETRRAVALSFIYPVLLLCFAWGLFAFSVDKVAPAVANAFYAQRVPGGAFVQRIAHLGKSAHIWGPLGPAVIVLLAIAWWIISGGARVVEGSRAAISFGWVPWMGRLQRLSRTAVFVEVLKLLVENRVPMDQAVELAAEAAGDKTLITAAAQWADGIRRGETSPADGIPGLPPLLRWLIAGGQRNEALLPALRQLADDYGRRAQDQAEMGRVLLPIFVTVCISGLIVAAYAIVLLGPYFYLLRGLARP
jgi:type II secretory pathway component PulF